MRRPVLALALPFALGCWLVDGEGGDAGGPGAHRPCGTSSSASLSRLARGDRPRRPWAPPRSAWEPRPPSWKDWSSRREASGGSCRTAPGMPLGRACSAWCAGTGSRGTAGSGSSSTRSRWRSTAGWCGASDACGWRWEGSGRSRASSTATGWQPGWRCAPFAGSRARGRASRRSRPASRRASSSGATPRMSGPCGGGRRPCASGREASSTARCRRGRSAASFGPWSSATDRRSTRTPRSRSGPRGRTTCWPSRARRWRFSPGWSSAVCASSAPARGRRPS